MFSDEIIQNAHDRPNTADDIGGELRQVGIKFGVFDAFLNHLVKGMPDNIDFVKCLQGSASCPGAGFHTVLSLRLCGIINIFNVYVHTSNLHTNHLRNRSRDFMLNLAAYVADVNVIL